MSRLKRWWKSIRNGHKRMCGEGEGGTNGESSSDIDALQGVN